MRLRISQVEEYLKKISASSFRTLQANVAQLFDFFQSQITQDNTKYLQYESDRKEKWFNWPENSGWKMPIDIDDSRSLSYNIYKNISEKGSEYLWQVYLNDIHEALTQVNEDFLDYFFQAIQTINNAEPGTDLDERKETSVDTSIVFVVHGRNEKLR